MGERERGEEGTKQILLLQLTKESLRMYVVLWKVIMWMLAGMCHIFDLEYETVLQ